MRVVVVLVVSAGRGGAWCGWLVVCWLCGEEGAGLAGMWCRAGSCRGCVGRGRNPLWGALNYRCEEIVVG